MSNKPREPSTRLFTPDEKVAATAPAAPPELAQGATAPPVEVPVSTTPVPMGIVPTAPTSIPVTPIPYQPVLVAPPDPPTEASVVPPVATQPPPYNPKISKARVLPPPMVKKPSTLSYGAIGQVFDSGGQPLEPKGLSKIICKICERNTGGIYLSIMSQREGITQLSCSNCGTNTVMLTADMD